MKNPLSLVRAALVAAAWFAIAPNLLANSVSPTSATVTENATKQFSAGTTSTWKTSCGSISSTGLFKAPLVPETCTITATAANGSGSSTAKATVVSPFTVTPYGPKTPQGQTWNFTATVPVRWTTTCGSIASTGSTTARYTASGAANTYCTIRAYATSGTAYESDNYDHVMASNYLLMSPTNISLAVNAKQQFSQSITSATPRWSASCGTITSTGYYTAPATANTCTVTVAAPPPPTGSGQVVSTTVKVGGVSALTISPVNPSLTVNGSLSFTASSASTWSASCGTISSTGAYTAPSTATTCSVTAKATDGSGRTASTNVTVNALANITISPLNPSVTVNGNLSFTASTAVTWAGSCGAITSSGAYTAPASPTSCSVTATATDGSNRTASTNVTVNPAASNITISPSAPTIYALGNVRFSATGATVTWSASCGSITNAGLYTAPGTPASCTVTATDNNDSSNTSSASVNVALVNYTTWLGDNKRTGANTQEYVLTPSNAGNLAQAWSASVDGSVWHQPLYMNAVNIGGSPHNVVFIGTSNDTVYAFDADSGATLWQQSFLSSGVTPVAGSSVGGAMTQMGIVGTPVIDPNSNTLYVVAFTAENNNTTFVHRLHALNINTGSDRTSPAVVQDSQFTDARHNNRAGLLLANGNVYVAFGGIHDTAPFHGYVFAYNASSLNQVAVINTTPGDYGGGIWQGTAAPAADDNGNVYVATGNGGFDGNTLFGMSALKLSPTLNVLDYFTPYNWQALGPGPTPDIDFGSAGPIVLPDQPGSHPHMLIVCGKPDPIYVMDRDNLGHNGSSSDNILQRITGQVGGTATSRDAGQSCYTNPAYWQSKVYFAGNGDVLKQFTMSNGQLSGTPSAQGSYAYGWPGAQPLVTSNGSSNGVVWTMDRNTCTIHANDANNLATSLYSGGSIGSCANWSTLTAVNAHIYAVANGKVVALSVSQ